LSVKEGEEKYSHSEIPFSKCAHFEQKRFPVRKDSHLINISHLGKKDPTFWKGRFPFGEEGCSQFEKENSHFENKIHIFRRKNTPFEKTDPHFGRKDVPILRSKYSHFKKIRIFRRKIPILGRKIPILGGKIFPF